MRFMLPLLFVVGCGDAVVQGDPMVGTWEVRSLTNDGETFAYPETEGQESRYVWTFREAENGQLNLTYTVDDIPQSEIYGFEIDVVTEGNWLVEIVDAAHDFDLDCNATPMAMECTGTCDGSGGCGWSLVRIEP